MCLPPVRLLLHCAIPQATSIGRQVPLFPAAQLHSSHPPPLVNACSATCIDIYAHHPLVLPRFEYHGSHGMSVDEHGITLKWRAVMQHQSKALPAAVGRWLDAMPDNPSASHTRDRSQTARH